MATDCNDQNIFYEVLPLCNSQTINYSIVFKNGNITKEVRFICPPRIQYVIIPSNMRNIAFVTDYIDKENAVSLIVNGYAKEVLQKLPMEFAVEAQKLLSVSLEGTVG